MYSFSIKACEYTSASGAVRRRCLRFFLCVKPPSINLSLSHRLNIDQRAEAHDVLRIFFLTLLLHKGPEDQISIKAHRYISSRSGGTLKRLGKYLAIYERITPQCRLSRCSRRQRRHAHGAHLPCRPGVVRAIVIVIVTRRSSTYTTRR